ncbi:MAG: RNA polymerase sigma factor [Deltaproteobacteria bacterium]|nr:RNA polymerase sigma factor [Deltaproteobacteria bacterium]
MRYSDTNIAANGIKMVFFQDMKVPNVIAAMYEKYNDRLYYFIERHLGSKDEVEDVAQEVYLRLIRHLERHNLTPSFALLRTIATNLMTDRFRKRRLQSADMHVPLEEVELASQDATPEEVAWSREGLRMIKDVFDGLNTKSREAFILHRFSGLTYEQIANEMGISRSMVQRHISRVLLELDKKFETEK